MCLSAQAFPHVATTEDVANAIVFLASPAAAAISGINLIIDCAFLTGVKGDAVLLLLSKFAALTRVTNLGDSQKAGFQSLSSMRRHLLTAPAEPTLTPGLLLSSLKSILQCSKLKAMYWVVTARQGVSDIPVISTGTMLHTKKLCSCHLQVRQRRGSWTRKAMRMLTAKTDSPSCEKTLGEGTREQQSHILQWETDEEVQRQDTAYFFCN